MAKITLTPGKLYFMRERDYLSQEISPYVKIGLVRNEKEAEQRILEHQTGNPREIFNVESLLSPMVEHLETLIHYRFAEKWITGEWFLLNDSELKTAIQQAKTVIEEQSTIAPVLENINELQKQESTEAEREPTQAEKELWQLLINKKLEIDVNRAHIAIEESKIRIALGNAIGIDGIASVQIRKGSTLFDEKSFKEKHPDLFEAYTISSSELKGPFTIKSKRSLKKEHLELYQVKAALPKSDLTLEEIDREKILSRTKAIEKAHLKYLSLQKIAYCLAWEYAQLEAKLKLCIGAHEGLIDLCRWNRVVSSKETIDKTALKKDEPIIYARFLVQKDDNYALKINTCRPYLASSQ